MSETQSIGRSVQLDKEEREQLEDVVEAMRERVEDNVAFQLQQAGVDEEPDDRDALDEETTELVEAIELETVGGDDWDEAVEEYVTGVGYTIVNRLAALRCMEVRDFIDEEVTVFREDGLTPAADRLVTEEFLTEEEAVLEAYQNACDDLAAEIEILFDRSTAYSQIDPDDETYADLCALLDDVPDAVWRADDVLGWVYEYYNSKLLDDLRRKGDREGFDPEDVPPANQFYTPHWVVRMLTDNSLGKLYLEDTGQLSDAVEAQDSLTPDERKNRSLSPNDSPDIKDFCTYLVPSEEEGEAPDFDGPRDIRVIDPACGSGHFLLYAFDVLERIYRAEADLDPAEIPREILRNNLYGVDLDMRACQLAAFNLYLKGRTRAEAEGASGFDMPEVGIVCADAKVADIEGVEEVFDEVADGKSDVEDALRRILDAFEEVHGLGSLLDVRGTLADLFEDDSKTEGVQITLDEGPTEDHSLGQILHSLRRAVEEHRESSSFLAQDLRSFIRLIDILAQDYDVSLMNPPYGTRNRMPLSIKSYIEGKYSYPAEFYINFFEVSNNLVKSNGRIGMLVPRTFMFKYRFREFRTDFIESVGIFDFLAEFGIGVLDNATVRTAGTVIRKDRQTMTKGNFFRLYDVPSDAKEQTLLDVLARKETDIKRSFQVNLEEFASIPGSSICYSTPEEVRKLHTTDVKLDADQAGVSARSAGLSRQGLATANDSRFYRNFWEVPGYTEFRPIATGGADAWIIPDIDEVVEWGDRGSRIKRFSQTVRTPNEDLYGKEGLTWTYIKETGRRFGYFPPGGLISATGCLYVPEENGTIWSLLATLNSELYHGLFLSITTGRHWTAGYVGSIPWFDPLARSEELEEIAKKQYKIKMSEEVTDPTSPYYQGPHLLLGIIERERFYSTAHKGQPDPSSGTQMTPPSNSQTILEAVSHCELKKSNRQTKIETLSNRADELIYSKLDISKEAQGEIQTEIKLRGQSGSDDKYAINDKENNVDELDRDVVKKYTKNLVHHFAMGAVREESDGIIPLQGTDGQTDMLERIVERFEDAYGEYAEDRLVEVDDILGAESAGDEAYPNLRSFIEDDLFAYHVDTMENTPIVWRLTTERLIADSTGEGFACFIDYQSIDSGLFDRLATQYLEPRKAELRERRTAADRRRGDDSLSASEQAEAAETYERCESGLNQIAVFEEVVQDLSSTDERGFTDEDRQRVEELAPKVAVFREETRERIETLAELYDRKGEDWFQDTFSDKFWDTVDEWRDEWLDALDELEHACEAYAKPNDEPVEAHLADLFDYFNWRLKGSDHYSSSGILFLTYYFEREGGDLLDEDGKPFETLTEDERMVASLATGLDDRSIVDDAYLEDRAAEDDVESVDDLPPIAEFKALADEIDDRCQAVHDAIPDDWSDRALSEITTAGYQPNHKHGVAVNITPLAEAEIVPEIVDDKVR
jgi:hypothetical protein